MITEPDVALTDYGLTLESAAFSYFLLRGDGHGSLRAWFGVFFGSVSMAAVAGGTVHGFFLDERTLGARVLWPAALLALGLVALAAWEIGATLRFAPPLVRKISLVARAEFVVYAGVVFFVSQAFAVAVLNYLPAMLFLAVVALFMIFLAARWLVDATDV